MSSPFGPLIGFVAAWSVCISESLLRAFGNEMDRKGPQHPFTAVLPDCQPSKRSNCSSVWEGAVGGAGGEVCFLQRQLASAEVQIVLS